MLTNGPEDNALTFTTKVTLFDKRVSGYDGMDRMLPQSTQTLIQTLCGGILNKICMTSA